ncbi:phosphoenolpyruvate--protein phosphotransferase [Cellulomonas fimi]|uniref:Phosphoenolpyruvate-protein phosphotransferase n=1 Tax=Cellulomonas fimi (strain ATCC 484 / DSM 20113 / JCM 1341 / CCUG 24087 / LMG 16345 / NBRC 15513 / NCIMB 8980 / NCTC 7547 / NRS-133) TaxID=590998 RepID=F4H2J1_CELFA|nr:phosphoenolpyruvate--protein phosphotransferase [Cellulomonas fimi]AEE45217.1 phosphoenolpyruvate-protein phosphotransferase [Cellulomonas fimi ATCC 484]NNH07117.1 phosphoenolpyruvate--protein phosphotransferase [Cellulomonas fimi]VEH28606.1 Phosphoenolpyruvate-protein phosphotransferase [Cellulomonas fimi]
MTGDRVLRGVGVGRRGVVGPVAQVQPAPFVQDDAPLLVDGVPADPATARQVVDDAFTHVVDDLRAQSARATGTVRDVLAATAQMADDKALRSQVLTRVAAGDHVVHAVDGVVAMFATMFEQAGGYLAERVTDLHSVRDRVVARALGLPAPGVPALDRPSVVVARDLAPADTAALDLDNVLAIVTELGGPTGHTAIIAGQLGLPCLVQVPFATTLQDGTEVAVDAAAGTVTVDPDDALRAELARRAQAEDALAADEAPGATADGHAVQLLANIGTPQDAERVAGTAVEGVGLFRTEVLFLERTTAPTRDEQARAYAQALAAMGERKVVVRTLDAGADKPLAFATQPDEENPALGVRGYRLVRRDPELLDVQLAALGAAQSEAGTPPWVMAPMVSTAAEARDFAARARAHGIATVGVMVEVPAAALRAREILAEVDFVSLGTNDLAQYTMATDRLRGELADLLDPWQPAVLDLVDATARAGQELHKPVGVCGESASDPLLALVLVGLGVTSLSMSAGAVPAVRYALRHHTRAQCATIAAAALAAPSAEAARAAVVALLVPEVRATLGV